jgi:hypothetical protein
VGQYNDGADWIWDLVGQFFGQAEQMIDWYHAKERLYTIGRLVFGEVLIVLNSTVIN